MSDILATERIAQVDNPTRRRSGFSVTRFLTGSAVALFVLTVLAVFATVLLYSVSTSWNTSWFPDGYTLSWFGQALQVQGLVNSIGVTFIVSFAVVGLSLLFGVPAAYVLARKNFPGRPVLMLLLLLPVVLSPLTYAVQLAATMYRLHLGGTLLAVILVNMVPILPLVILVMIPFIEQISPNVENAARVFGAGTGQLFMKILAPLLVPGIVAAGVLAFVRVLGSFELTFFVSNAKTQTLVVTIFGKMADPSAPPVYLTAAMTVFYMVFALIGLIASLRFSDPAKMLGSTAV